MKKSPRSKTSLAHKYPPSPPCTCEICRGFCARPGWWTVAEAAKVIQTGYAGRMMLDMAPDRSFGVLAPAFKGCEAQFAQQRYAGRGCTFLEDDLCELFGTGLQPLECRFCYHSRPGLGLACHADLEKDWHTPEGTSLVVQWSKLTGFWERINLQVLAARAKRAG